MIVGEVNSLPEAVVRLAVRGPAGREREIEAVVDTGYTGALTLPAELISELALPFRSLTRALLADGRETICATHEANVSGGHSSAGCRSTRRKPNRSWEWPSSMDMS